MSELEVANVRIGRAVYSVRFYMQEEYDTAQQGQRCPTCRLRLRAEADLSRRLVERIVEIRNAETTLAVALRTTLASRISRALRRKKFFRSYCEACSPIDDL